MSLNNQPTIKALLLGLLFSLTAFQPALATPKKVITSIKPLQLIAQAITQDVSTVDVLLPPGASPHSHSMKPSEARKLAEADIIFWVGPDMEVFLEKMLSGSKATQSVPVMKNAKLKLRKSSTDEMEEADEHAGHGGHEDHHHGDYDAHIWLSPYNAVAIAKTMTDRLVKLDPANKKKYRENLKTFKSSIQAADKRNYKKLANYHQKPMFVFHDAYGYLQDHYKLNVVDHFAINPELKPGAKHLQKLTDKIKAAGKSCVFREPQFQSPLVDTITNGTKARVAVLDPLAMDVEPGPEGYAQFVNGLVDNIVECFK